MPLRTLSHAHDLRVPFGSVGPCSRFCDFDIGKRGGPPSDPTSNHKGGACAKTKSRGKAGHGILKSFEVITHNTLKKALEGATGSPGKI